MPAGWSLRKAALAPGRGETQAVKVEFQGHCLCDSVTQITARNSYLYNPENPLSSTLTRLTLA